MKQIRKISITDPDFQANEDLIAKASSAKERPEFIFGEDTLQKLDSATGEVARKVVLGESRRKILAHLADTKVTHYHHQSIFSFFSELLKSAEIMERLQVLSNGELEDREDKEDLIRMPKRVRYMMFLQHLFKHGPLPDDLHEMMLRHYVAHCRKKSERLLKTDVPRFCETYLRKLSALIEKYYLPITVDLIAQRLAKITFRFQDKLSQTDRKNQGCIFGFYRPNTDEVGLGSQYFLLDNPEHTADHEITHVASGHTPVEIESGSGPVSYGIQRVGLSFAYDPKREPDSNPNEIQMGLRFNWLNEAITESFALELSGFDDKDGYPEERELFELLLANGSPPIDRAVFYRAFFENFDPAQKPPVPLYRTLIQQINFSYRKGFLVRLDRVVAQKGIQEALRLMREDWTKLYDISLEKEKDKGRGSDARLAA